MKKLFTHFTMFLKDGEQLEELRKIFTRLAEKQLWGYDETLKDEKEVSSGFFHFESGMFFLSKDDFGKRHINLEEVK